eukprot:TRINITY_DN23017_c0_g1_i1.p1 TRINITY_DN23017_c0_g1~~TRINITY_DN23017_c0_g1_i1.p1  ORF type:complete len:184 (+),score=43.66 TRINITY_DN23017_c0_g1_i1:81-632(+)
MSSHFDIEDTFSSSAFPSGAGTSLTVPCISSEPTRAGSTFHKHLAREYLAAEKSAAAAGISPVSSVMSIDLGQIERQYSKWCSLMPRVRPFYAVKSNPDPEIVRTLLHAGAGFDCASAKEIMMVREAGAQGSDVIFANCCKFPGDCLLYTSDAADDLLCVDLGGRRILKKKNNSSTDQRCDEQ